MGLGFHPLDGDRCEDEVDVAGGVKAETLGRLGPHAEGDLVVGRWVVVSSEALAYFGWT